MFLRCVRLHMSLRQIQIKGIWQKLSQKQYFIILLVARSTTALKTCT